MSRLKTIFCKWNSLSDAAKSSVAFIVSTFIVKGMAFIVTPIFTRIISTDQYGVISSYNSWLAIIEVFAVLGLTSAGVFNVGLNEHKEDRSQFISSIVVLCNIVTIFVFAILFFVKDYFSNLFLLSNSLVLAMFIYFMFSPSQVFWITRQRYEYRYKLPFIVTVFSALVSQLISVICIICISTENQAELKIWSTLLATLLFQIPIYIILLIKGKCGFNVNIWKSTLTVAVPLLPHYLAQHIMSNSDRIMLQNMTSNTYVAIYSVVATISMVSTIVWSAINASLVPFTYEKMDANREQAVNKVVNPLLVFYALICFSVTLAGPELLKILAPSNYYEGVVAIPPIAITAFVTALYNLYANIEFYHKKSWWIAFSTVVAALLNVGLNYLLIPKFGYVGAAYTTLVSQSLLVLFHYFGYRRSHAVKIYNDKVTIGILLIVILLCESCNLLYLNNIVRYALISIIVIVLVLKKSFILEKIKLLKS